MTNLHISEQLAQAIQTEAAEREQTIEDFLQSVLRREKTLANRRKITQEQAWWMQLPLRERAKYEGEYVAIYQKKLIDHDPDRRSLATRVRKDFHDLPVLIMPAEGPREIWIHSPHFRST